LHLPVVCDNDSHFWLAEDWDAHDSLCCISMGKNKTSIKDSCENGDSYGASLAP